MPKGIRLTQAEIDAIRKAAAAGTANRQIAIAIGRDPKTVNTLVRKLADAGELEPRQPRISPALREKIGQHAHRTASNAVLAAELGCTVWQVRSVRQEFTSDARKRARKSYLAKLQREGEDGASDAPVDKLGDALRGPRFPPLSLPAPVPATALSYEDAAWAAGRKVPPARDLDATVAAWLLDDARRAAA